MTLLGELYANGLGVERDDKKAAEWYGLAVERGDREAMFALAMLQLGGPRPAPAIANRGPSCSPPPPSSGMPPPPTISACSTSRAKCFRRISAARPNCSAAPRRPALPEAQYALATLYKEGRGVHEGFDRGGSPPRRGVRAPTTPMRKSNMPSRCSTEREAPNETSGWRRRCWRRPHARATRSRKTVSPIFLRSDAACRPMRWRRSSGTSSPRPAASSDIPLDTFVQKQTPEIRAAGEKAAKPWLDALKEQRESRS